MQKIISLTKKNLSNCTNTSRSLVALWLHTLTLFALPVAAKWNIISYGYQL